MNRENQDLSAVMHLHDKKIVRSCFHSGVINTNELIFQVYVRRRT
jgi:hypothetical protein